MVNTALESVPVVDVVEVVEIDMEGLSHEPSEEEIQAAIRQLKDGKASREDVVSEDLLLKLGEDVIDSWVRMQVGNQDNGNRKMCH